MKRCVLTTTVAFALLASHALAQEREWNLDIGETEGYLIFGVPESDDVGISLWCGLKSGTINVFVPEANAKLAVGPEAKVTIAAGGKNFSFKAKTMPNEEAGTTSTEAAIPATDPVFKALTGADRFTVSVQGEDQNFPLEGADFQGFLKICGAD